MLHFIETLQKKPKHVRHNVALALAAVITAITALFWLGAASVRFGEAEAEDAASPFVLIRDQAESLSDDVTTFLSEVKNR